MGLKNSAMKSEVLRNFKHVRSVSDVIEMCEVYESANKVVSHEAVQGGAIEASAGPRLENGKPRSSQARRGATENGAQCKYCGLIGCPGKPHCPAMHQPCYICQKLGHFAAVCRLRGQTLTTTGAITISSAPGNSEGPTDSASLEVRVTGLQAGTSVTAVGVADTGADACIAGPGLLRALNLTQRDLQRAPLRINHIAGGGLKILGRTPCTFEVYGRRAKAQLYIAEGVNKVYLSLRTCKDLHLVSKDFPRPSTTAGSTEAQVASTSTIAGGTVAQVARPPTTARTPPARPSAPPFALTEANVDRLEKYLIEHFGDTTFATGKTPLPVMAGPPHHIHLRPDAEPHAVHAPATIPHHFYDEVKQQLDEDVRRGVIEEVPAGEPTQWCARMVVVPKKDGRARRTVDFQRVNRACRRETHHTRTPFDMISSIPKHTFKTVVDAYSGYHQIQLDEESKKLTTFITPWGRYRYCRTPMGHCAAQDAFTKRFDDVINAIPRKIKCVDDTLLHDNNVESAFWHCYDMLETCARGGVTLRPDKFKFCRRNVDFAGYHLEWDQYRPSGDLLEAISSFQMPAQPTLTDVRAWFGLVNQVAPFLAVAPLMEPFRELLKRPSGKQVYWDAQLRSIFEQSRDVIGLMAKEGL